VPEDPEQLELFPDAALPPLCDRSLALALGEILQRFGVHWFSYAEWAAPFLQVKPRLVELGLASGESPETVERRWLRLREALRLRGLDPDQRQAPWLGETHNAIQIRLTPALLAFRLRVFPARFDEPENDLNDEGEEWTLQRLDEALYEDPDDDPPYQRKHL